MSESGTKFKHLLNYIGNGLKESNANAQLGILKEATVSFHEYQTEVYSYGEIHVELPAQLHRHCIAKQLVAPFESSILRLANQAIGLDEFFVTVRIQALPEDDDSWRGGTARPIHPSPDETSRLWKEGYFRLFLSHSSQNKQFAAELKASLLKVNIDTFVAHEDIEPNLEWQNEIQLGLSSCHALLYLATQAANTSIWCQQELGWALGRGVFITSYKLIGDPVGFPNVRQGWSCPGHDCVRVRHKLLSMLVKQDRTEPVMRGPLVRVLLDASSASQATFALEFLEQLKSIDEQDLGRLQSASFPSDISGNKAIMQRVLTLFKTHGATGFTGSSQSAHLASTDDDFDPFEDD